MRLRLAVTLVLMGVFLPFAALRAQAQWQLVEDLRFGSDASEMTIFTDIRGIIAGSSRDHRGSIAGSSRDHRGAAGPRGNIFVLDWRPQEIRLFDRAARFVSLVSRTGQGPGETTRAAGRRRR